jgi:FkbM family methyltransferase
MVYLTAQFGEDMYIFNNFINCISPDGTFVELGGMDGITYSISYFFEKSLMFKGVLIEPTNQYEKLIINRPDAKCYNYAIYHSYDEKIFLGNGATGGLLETMNDNFKLTYHKNSNDKYLVKCMPMKDIINDSGLKYIDLLTIDVEGCELVVLETFDFSIPVYVIVIELDGGNQEKDQKCRDILLKNGFTFNIRVCINEFWINTNYFRRDKLFNKNETKLSFNNMHMFGNIPFLDMNNPKINELKESLLINNDFR